ncbi:hypothetical protein V3W47_11385 [Deinococcus sp. YIM 134068]|uniref:hypothetical protein n=1 Tax=Deinococcus lichenicola TaxID=3118910 RepID=UPI002F91CA3B
MAYQGTLGDGATVTVENEGGQTQVQVHKGGQNQGSGLTTGAWKAAPTLWQISGRAVLEIEGDGKTYIEISRQGVRSLEQAPDLSGAAKIELSEVEDGGGIGGMKPMEPMKPLGEDE